MKHSGLHTFNILLLLLACSCLCGCVGIHDELDAGIILEAQAESVNILEHESFVFRVMSAAADITDRSRIFEVTESGNVPVDGAVFTPGNEGAYTFVAECEGHVSPPLYLSAVAVQHGGDRFLRKSLVLDFTATWCVNCPAMSQAISRAAALSGGRIDKIAVYYLDDLQVPAGSALASRFGVQALPHVVSGLDEKLATSVASEDVIYAHNRQVLEQSKPACGIAISSTVTDAGLSVRVEVASAAAGSYYLGVAVVEDGIVAKQTGASDYYVHNSVLRSLLHSAQPSEGLGDALGWMEEGQTAVRTFTAPAVRNAFETRIMAYLVDEEGRLNNAASCAVGEDQPYQYE